MNRGSLKRLIIYVKPYYLHIVITALASIGCSMANVWVIDILMQIIDKTISKEIGFILPEIVAKVAFVIAVGLLTNYLVVAMTGFLGAGILRNLRSDCLKSVVRTAPDFMERNNFGDIIERMSSDIEGIAGYMQTYFKDCLYVPVIVVVFAFYLISLHPLLAAACLIPLAVLVPLSIILLKPVKVAQAEYVKQLGMTNNNIQEAFDGADVIKSYNLQKTMSDKYYNALKKTFDISNRTDLRQYNIEPISALVREAPIAIALCVGGFLAFRGEVSVGMLIAFISAIKKINEPLVYAYQLVIRTQMALIAVNRVFYVMDLPAEDEEGKATEVEKNGEEVFRLRNVSFSYHNGDVEVMEADVVGKKQVLNNINLTVKEGQKIALVGKSGCGKSTIMKLLCRQYEVNEGELFYYGHNYSGISPACVRKDIAVISQDNIMFPLSVLDNIRIGNPDAGREEIIGASKLAGCDEFICNMPDGYDTFLEEKGANLSGGQRQRIAIARAILKDAPILLLDEPTSALDKETEQFISNTLSEIAEGKTVVTVAHRLSTITDYDEIIVINAGEIAERGTHEELIHRQGLYHKMYLEYIAGGVEG